MTPEVSPDKNFGQHWLEDDAILESICDQADVSKADVVLEIGAGRGTLTAWLAMRAKEVWAVEVDERHVAELQRQFAKTNVRVVNADFMRFDLAMLPVGYKVVANIPYYLTSRIIKQLLNAQNPPRLATLLMQQEVAEKLTARPGDMNLLALEAQLHCTLQPGRVVPAAYFTPPPEVDSQVITLKWRDEPLFPDVATGDYLRVAKAGFGEKRKKLRNSLSGGLQLEKEIVDSWLARAHIATNARAEELGLEDWHRLLKARA